MAIERHEVPWAGSLHGTADWLRERGQRVAGPFGAMGATPALFWTPVTAPNAAPRMALPGDVLLYTDYGAGDGDVLVATP